MLASAPAAAIAALLLLGATAGAARVPGATTVPAGESLAHFVHRPGTKLSAARLARSSIAWSGGRTVATSGETVTVYVSPALPAELGTPQTWADFIAGLVHGPELSSLSAYIATHAETQGICGEHALGCYAADRMVSMGETASGVTAADVVRHEYGHHIAFHRLNAPWTAIDWGPKHWATSESVCPRTGAGTAYPGARGSNYGLNPGEAWAETYRLLDERRAGVAGAAWDIIDPSFYPDEAAFLAAERDVLQPWAASRTVVAEKRFVAGKARVWTLPLRTPLDGSVAVTVTLPRNGLHEVALVDTARRDVLASALWASQRVKRIVTNVCGQRALTVRVAHKGAFGRVRVVAQIP
jgi:hypothetical protein